MHKEEVKVTDVKAAVETKAKETAKAVETKAKETAKVVETKAKETAKVVETKAKEVEKKAAPKKAAAAKKATAAKTAAKKTVAKAAAKTVAVKAQTFVQYQNNEVDLITVEERVKAQFVSEGHKASSIKQVNIYIKPEEYTAYYVINEKFVGRVDLF